MKKCTVCVEDKPFSDYYKNNRTKDGLHSHCKSCHNKMNARWRANHTVEDKKHHRRSNQNYRMKYPERVREQSAKSRAKHKEKYTEKLKIKKEQKRREVLQHYGNKCICCGESNFYFLTLDHKASDGSEHRKTFKDNIVDWIVKNDFPEMFQVLCYNCNLARSFYGGKEKICPHKWSENLLKEQVRD